MGFDKFCPLIPGAKAFRSIWLCKYNLYGPCYPVEKWKDNEKRHRFRLEPIRIENPGSNAVEYRQKCSVIAPTCKLLTGGGNGVVPTTRAVPHGKRKGSSITCARWTSYLLDGVLRLVNHPCQRLGVFVFIFIFFQK